MYSFAASQTLPQILPSPVVISRQEIRALNFTQELNYPCRSEVCLWNALYLNHITTSAIHPCDDFYQHVCASNRWDRSDYRKYSFAQLSRNKLLKDFDLFFERFFTLKEQQSRATESNFLTQAKSIYTACKGNRSSSEDQALEAFGGILATMHLSEWPYAKFAGDVLYVVSTADRIMMLQTIFKIHVQRGNRQNWTPRIVLRAPETYLSKFSNSASRNNTVHYKDTIARALVRKVTPVSSLRNSHHWQWLKYFELLFNASDGIPTNVFVEDPEFFSSLPSVFEPEDRVTTIANYVGLKVLLTLWPFMPTAFHFLYVLNQDRNIAPIDARIAACSAMLEKLYRYGVGIAAKLAASGEFADVYRRLRDEQLAVLFRDAQGIVRKLLQSGSSWFGQRDVDLAVRKLDSMTFSFGTQQNFEQYEEYRKTPDLTMTLSASVLEAVLSTYVHASSLYWNALDTSLDSSAAYDNAYTASVFDFDVEYQPTNNHVFIPNAIVGFLNSISNAMPIQVYPLILQNIIRALIRALLEGNSLFDGSHVTVSKTWDMQTIMRYHSAMKCLQQQYDAVEGAKNRVDSTWTLARSEEVFLDTAVIRPLYELYSNAIKDRNQMELSVKLQRKIIGPKELFFYNYALAHCDYDDLKLRNASSPPARSPPKIQLNVALHNFPPFRKTFSCAATPETTDSCEIWKVAASSVRSPSEQHVPLKEPYGNSTTRPETKAILNYTYRSTGE
ncbi:hypothetical protein MTO96_041704 [Rhipicephalus appendiculatus]